MAPLNEENKLLIVERWPEDGVDAIDALDGVETCMTDGFGTCWLDGEWRFQKPFFPVVCAGVLCDEYSGRNGNGSGSQFSTGRCGSPDFCPVPAVSPARA